MTRVRAQQPRLFWAEYAWLGGGSRHPATLKESVVIGVEHGRIASVESDVADVPKGAITLAGLTLPGMANVHSHAFHRLSRGQDPLQAGASGTWREHLEQLAQDLTPDSYGRLAADVFTEMVQAGYTSVGEFHYVHHELDGRPYGDAHAMELAVVEAAQSAGIRITLLDACFLRSGFGRQVVDDNHLRFTDGTVQNWEARVEGLARTLRGRSTVRLGGAIYDLGAINPDDASVVVRWANGRQLPFHAHLAQTSTDARDAKRLERATPVELLLKAGIANLDAPLCVAHSAHLSATDIVSLGESKAFVACCPTSEQLRADGFAPTNRLLAAGVRLCVGSDDQTVIGPIEELRSLELHHRLVHGERGTHTTASLLHAGSSNGYAALGWEQGGALQVGFLADFVSVATSGDRLRHVPFGTLSTAVLLSATGDDVHHVVVNGEVIVRDGRSIRRPVPLFA